MCDAAPVYRFPSFSFCQCQCARLRPVPAVACAPVRLSHCAMRGPVPHTLTWGPIIGSLGAPWSSLVPLVFIFSMLAPPGGAVAEVNSQGAGVLLVKISSVLNPEGRDAAGACCAAAGKVRWDILFLFPNFPHHLNQPGPVPGSVFHHAACLCDRSVTKFKVGIYECDSHGKFNILGVISFLHSQVASNTVEFRKLPGGACCRYRWSPSGATLPTCRQVEQEKNCTSNN